MATPTFQFNYDPRAAANGGPGVDGDNNAIVETGHLTIGTDMMQMVFEGGSIVYVKDLSTNEVFVNASSYAINSIDLTGYSGFSSRDVGLSVYNRQPGNDHVSLVSVSAWNKQLVYSPLHVGQSNSLATGTELIVDILVESTGEIVINMTGTDVSGYTPYTIDLPIMHFKGDSVLLGKGREYLRADSAYYDSTGSDLTAEDAVQTGPHLIVATGDSGVLAAWSESQAGLLEERIVLSHTTTQDELVMHDPQDSLQTADDPLVINSGPWRIGVYTDWLTVVKRWRVLFEERTGAAPLWENRCTWVQDIHAVYFTVINKTSETLAALNAITSAYPGKILYHIPNDWPHILFGDLRSPIYSAIPNAAQIGLIKGYGWKLIIYSAWTLIHSSTGQAARLAALGEADLPDGAGYVFEPDCPGGINASNWFAHWSGISTNYYDGANQLVLHPGSAEFKAFFEQYFPDFCDDRSIDGMYFDTLGTDLSSMFSSGEKVEGSENYIKGCVSTIQALTTNDPQYGIMAEYLTPYTIPFTFYTWEAGIGGAITDLVNHPIRTALVGSYTWTQEQPAPGMIVIDYLNGALKGTLPRLAMTGDAGTTTEAVATVSQARAHLFCHLELFNALPDVWNPLASAYYWSKYTGYYVRFEDRGSDTFAYVEEHPTGDYERLVIYSGEVTVNNIDVELTIPCAGSLGFMRF